MSLAITAIVARAAAKQASVDETGAADLNINDRAILLLGERRHRILDLLAKHGRVTADGLAKTFATSTATIRNDLAALASAGALDRTH